MSLSSTSSSSSSADSPSKIPCPLPLLPDLVLLRVLERLPLAELLLTCKLVCRRWADLLVPAVLRKRTSLTIFGKNCLDYYSNAHSLRCDRLLFFGIEAARFDLLLNFCSPDFLASTNGHLLASFPNIRQLTVVHYNITEANQANLASFLINWPDSLTELRFVGLRSGTLNWNLFAGKLNQLSQLTTLSIDVNISRLKDLTIYPNLRSINCRFVRADRVEVNLYSRRLPNELLGGNCTDNRLQRIGFFVDDNGLLNCLSKVEAAKVDRLAIIVGFVSQLKLLSIKFPSLQYLDLTFYDNESNINCFLAALARLQSLTSFRLFMSPLHNYFMKICQDNVGSLPKLPSVRQVELQFPLEPHKFELIERIFPNADQVTINVEHFLFADFGQLLCKERESCTRCSLIADQLELVGEQANVSLKFGFKNGVLLF
ncbi:hypothetical protein TYRP_021279 [Tyrophagus putrescentiae]|nr:hypothetical protein TYRP_021279 [Tyrophagus putrescentiae]